MEPVSFHAERPAPEPRSVGAFVPPLVAPSEWDRLLNRLGLTDKEALAAVREGRELSQAITRFVREESCERFVPEEVLLAVNLQWKAAQENAMIFRSLLSAYRGMDS